LQADVFVADTQLHYRAPLFADLHAEARLEQEDAWPDFVARLRERGRAGVRMAACVRLPDGGVAAQSQARYVAVGKG
jgi:thioesterase domain-containing protein